MLVLGIAGRKNAGKDTVGQYFCKKHGFTRLAFADPLKQEVQDYLTSRFSPRLPGMPLELHGLLLIEKYRPLFFSSSTSRFAAWFIWFFSFLIRFIYLDDACPDSAFDKPTSPRMRRILQLWGTEFRQAVYGQDYWVLRVRSLMTDPLGRYVITDVRFIHELEFVLHECLGRMLFVLNPSSVADTHLSESTIYPRHCSFTVRNAGDIQQLHDSIELVLTEHGKEDDYFQQILGLRRQCRVPLEDCGVAQLALPDFWD